MADHRRVASLDGAWRNERARARREQTAAALEPPPRESVADAEDDDALNLLLLCCHDALSAPSQVALTLRAVGGLTTVEIARALLVPESTVAQRISAAPSGASARAGATFEPPPEAELRSRLDAVLRVLYLIFTEGSTASSGPALHRVDLSSEAIRLARQLHAKRPADGEITGLVALMLLTDARRPARTLADGTLVPLTEQDRSLWDQAAIAEGVELDRAPRQRTRRSARSSCRRPSPPSTPRRPRPRTRTGRRYSACTSSCSTGSSPGPMTALNRAVAVGEVHGPAAGLAAAGALADDPRLGHRLDAVRGHFLARAGDPTAAADAYAPSGRGGTQAAERRHLATRAQNLNKY